jgi:hypothetical protein
MTVQMTNRREAARLTAQDNHGIVSIRIRPGHAASVVDVSASGVLIETAHRLLPGTAVDLHIEAGGDRASFRARVVRCAVVSVRAAGIAYRGAVAFDRQLPWFATVDGDAGVRSGARTIMPAWAPATPVAV